MVCGGRLVVVGRWWVVVGGGGWWVVVDGGGWWWVEVVGDPEGHGKPQRPIPAHRFSGACRETSPLPTPPMIHIHSYSRLKTMEHIQTYMNKDHKYEQMSTK